MLGQPMSMLIPQVIGFKLDGRAARGRDRDRPRAHRHRDAAQEGRRRQVRRVLRPGRDGAAAGRPRDDRQHEPGVRLDLRDLPDRRRDAALPGVLRPARRSSSTSSRPTPRSRASGTTSTPRSRPTPTRSSSTCATVEPVARRARSARRTASPLTGAKESFRAALAELRRRRRRRDRRRPRRGDRRERSRPPTRRRTGRPATRPRPRTPAPAPAVAAGVG